MDILIASHRPDDLAEFAAGLSAAGAKISTAPTGTAALDAVKAHAPTLCVVDEGLPDVGAFALVARLLHINALVHTAVVSELSDEDFHEAGEGLGILHRLPLHPGVVDAKNLLTALSAVS